MEAAKEQRIDNRAQFSNNEADIVEITYYTDPLCCWSWALEPQWRRLQYEYRGKIRWQYKMCGLLPGWKNFHDPVNSVSRPIQMGPVWMHAKEISGMPMQFNIWVTDPPASSYPACIAFKCVQLQSTVWAEHYLRMLREACMLQGLNLAKNDVLINVAVNLKKLFPQFDQQKFLNDFSGDAGIEAFRSDLNETKNFNINRYPSLIIRYAGNAPILITGYRPYQSLVSAIEKVNPQITPSQILTGKDDYIDYWPSLTARELEEAFPKVISAI